MTTITARVIADSVNAHGVRLTTMEWTYPRFIHAEIMTHRGFARNAASSRAIPSARMRANIRRDMAIPVEWGTNQKGMQAGAPLSRWRAALAWFAWVMLGHVALLTSWALDKIGCHKQLTNRVTEAWSHITVILTGTDTMWSNLFALRAHPMAEPTFQVLAWRAVDAYRASRPVNLERGEWHLPYIDGKAYDDALAYCYPGASLHEIEQILAKMSTARCARVSYLNHDGKPTTVDDDLKLYFRLMGGSPKHASPAEHQARAASEGSRHVASLGGCFGPRSGWVQHRKTIPEECAVFDFDLAAKARKVVR